MQLLVHSVFSFFESNISIDKYIKYLSSKRSQYSVLTDKNNLYAMWDFIKTSTSYQIKPIVGVHIAPILPALSCGDGGFLVFVKNSKGLKSLYSITSAISAYQSSLNISDLASNQLRFPNSILANLPSRGSYFQSSLSKVFETITRLSSAKSLEDLIFVSLTNPIYSTLKCLGIPSNNLFFGLIEDIFPDTPFLSSRFCRFIEQLPLDCKPVFISKAAFFENADREFLCTLKTLKHKRLVKNSNKLYNKRQPILQDIASVYRHFHLYEFTKYFDRIDQKTTELSNLSNFESSNIDNDNRDKVDKAKNADSYPLSLDNPYNILSAKAKKLILSSLYNSYYFYTNFTFDILPKKPVFPSFFNEPDSNLASIALSGLKQKGKHNNEIYQKRLNYELDVICKKGFSQYFLFVYDILQYAKKNNISYIGRGSAASSLVSYLLGISEVDPIQLDLYFERFLNPARQSYPDIDIDFSWKDRDKIFSYIFKKHPFSSCMVSTNITMNLKSAFRNAARQYGMPEANITKLSKLIPSFYKADSDEKLNIYLTKNLLIPQNISSLTCQLINLPVARGPHPAGIVLSSPDILSSTPIQYATKGVCISHFDLNNIEDAGLIKIDILSQRAAGTLSDSIKMIKKLYDSSFDLPFDKANNDAQTWAVICKGETRGCFYIESPAMIGLLKDLKVSNFLELVAASSVIRPGVSDSGMKQEYILRKIGKKRVEYLFPDLKALLHETNGVMIYQEDVLKVVHTIGKLSIEEADLLRAAMSGKSRSRKQIESLKDRFINGGLSQGYNITQLEKLWKQIESFAGYAFCKAHSASFAILSVKLAFIKTHFKEVFYASVLNNSGGYYSPFVYNVLALTENIQFDISKVRSSSLETFYDGNKIIIGLNSFYFLEKADTAAIVAFKDSLNKDEPFLLGKFIFLTHIDKSRILKLIQIGFFSDSYSSIGYCYALCNKLFLLKNRSYNNLVETEKTFSKSISLFRHESLRFYYYRYKYLGMFVDITPFDILWQLSQQNILSQKDENIFNKYTPIEDYTLYTGKTVIILGWLATHRSAIADKDKLMGFATFFDGNSFIESVFFPPAYEEYYSFLKYFSLFLIKLDVQIVNTSLSLSVVELKPFIPDIFTKIKEAQNGKYNQTAERNTLIHQ